MNKKVVNEFCEHLFSRYPKTVGIAGLELDCGCAKLGGCNKKGDQSTPMFSLPAKLNEIGEAIICLDCLKDNTGIGRVLRGFLIMRKDKKLSTDVMNRIRKKAFGE
jgi:hypothetical protein